MMSPNEEAQGHANLFAALSAREREVLECMVSGSPNKLTAEKLGISPRTVEVHRARVMKKMQAESFADLVRMAVQVGILPDVD